MAARNVPTYKDIQSRTGLSLATISKYFNGRNVLDENRRSIEAAVSALGFRRNTIASGLRRGASRTVGMLLPSLQNTFHLSIVVGVERALRAQGIGILVSSNEGEDDADGGAVELLLSRQVDGIISVPSAWDAPALAHASADGVPVVSIDWEAAGLETDTVALDNAGAGRLAGRHLADHGHSSVAIVVGADDVSTMRDRLAGFEAVFSPAAASRVSVARGPLTVEGGRTAMHRLLHTETRPTAVFAANYELTVGALIALNESGLRLGQDISMIGFDSVELARVTRPQLTIVAQPVEEIAKEAARLIQHRLDAPSSESLRPVTTRLPGILVVGNSVTNLRDELRTNAARS